MCSNEILFVICLAYLFVAYLLTLGSFTVGGLRVYMYIQLFNKIFPPLLHSITTITIMYCDVFVYV